MKLKIFMILFLGGVLFSSCNVTRRLGTDQYLLSKNKIRIEREEGLPRSEYIQTEELAQYIRQRPNKRLFGLNFYLGIYNLSKPDKQNWTKRIGEAPVIYDAQQTLRSVDAMSIYLRSQGFFDSDIYSTTDTTKKKIGVTYHVRQGMPTRIGNITFDYQDKFLEPIIREDSSRTLIHSGDIFNFDLLQAERQRITDYVKQQGYYTFSINNISYVADTAATHPGVYHLKMIVKQRTAGYNEQDEPILENNSVYRIRDIYVVSDYDAGAAAADSNYFRTMDTLEYRGVKFLYHDKQNVRPDVLMRAINIYPNYLYDITDVNRAYDNVMKLNYFRSVNILFSEQPDTTSNLITFIGDGGEEGSTNLTQESYLSCNILCTPGMKQSYSIDGEGTGTSSYYGLLMTLGYQNRNIFRGAELFDFSITGGYEFMHGKTGGRKNSIEIGGTVGLTLPHFMAPFRIDPYNRVNSAKTRIELSVNWQNRRFYNRVLTSGSFGYSWINNRFSSFTLRPVDISIIKLNSVDESWLQNIVNQYIRNSYTSQLIAGISGSYLFNNQASSLSKSTFRVRVNGETNGNLLNLVAPLFTDKSSEGDYYKFFGIRYAQYFRADVDASYRFSLGEKSSFVYRLYVGSGTAYGNSRNVSIPFERLFYAGGPNSMRGWQVRTLGPGGVEFDRDTLGYPTQLGNFKLEANVEFRFPVYKVLQGALFADLGNIWMVGRKEEGADPRAYFKFNRFYDQLGLNAGLGARFDFGYFLFRIDWGLRLHDPNKPVGQKWIRHLTLRQSAFSFNVGYPF